MNTATRITFTLASGKEVTVQLVVPRTVGEIERMVARRFTLDGKSLISFVTLADGSNTALVSFL